MTSASLASPQKVASQTSSGSFFVGVDISKLSFDASLAPIGSVNAEFSKLPACSFEMNKTGVGRFGKWLEKELGTAAAKGIVIEATGTYSKRFAELLKPKSFPPVSTVNPYYPSSYKRSLGIKDKTDCVDARVLALYGATRTPAPDKETNPEQAKLKELQRLCDDYETDILSWKNRLEQVEYGESRVRIKKTIAQFEASLREVRNQIELIIKASERMRQDVKLMCTVPGIGEKTAIMLLAELGDLRDWKREKIVSFCGLYLRQHTSGKSVSKRPRLSKGGGWRVRRGLFMCCLALRSRPTLLKKFGDRLIERGKSKMCAIGAMMRKLLLLVRAVVVSGVPYDPHFSSSPT